MALTDLIALAHNWLVPAPMRSFPAPRPKEETAAPILEQEPEPSQLLDLPTDVAAPVPERELEPEAVILLTPETTKNL
jgi:hypothetical protein